MNPDPIVSFGETLGECIASWFHRRPKPPKAEPPSIKHEVVSETRREEPHEAQVDLDAMDRSPFEPPDFPGLLWGNDIHGLEAASGHYGAVAQPKTAKSKAFLEPLLASWLPHVSPQTVSPQTGWGAAVLGVKPKVIVPLIHRCAHPDAEIDIIDPTDVDGSKLDHCELARTDDEALELGEDYLPDFAARQSNYWHTQSRNLLGCAFIAAQHLHPDDWDLWEIYHLIHSSERHYKLLRKCKATRADAKDLESGKMAKYLTSHLKSQLGAFRAVCAASRHCTNKAKISELLKGGHIWYLPYHSKRSVSCRATIRMVLRRIIKEKLSANDGKPFLLFADEISVMQGLEDSLMELFRIGRDPGIVTAIGVQHLNGLLKTFGTKENVEEVLGLIQNLVVGRCDHITAKFMSEAIGRSTVKETTRGTNESANVGTSHSSGQPGSTSTGSSAGNDVRVSYSSQEVFSEDVIKHLRLARRSQGIADFIRKNCVSANWARVAVPYADFWDLLDLKSIEKDYEGYRSRPESESRLQPWADADQKKWKIK